MAILYRILPQTLDATGIGNVKQGQGDFGEEIFCNVLVVNNTPAGGATCTLKWTDRHGRDSSFDISPGQPLDMAGVRVRNWSLTGNGAQVNGAFSDEKLDPKSFVVSVSGTVSTSIDGQTVGVAPSTTLAGSAVDPRTRTWTLGPGDNPDNTINQSKGLRIAGTTLIEEETFPPTSVPAAQGLTVKVTGATALALGQRVAFSLSGFPGTLASGAAQAVFIAIRGATSGNYYAICQNGASVAGEFSMPVAEKLNIVTQNADGTNAHLFAGNWSAMGP